MAKGAFDLVKRGEDFNLKPKNGIEVPDDQTAVSVGVYGIVGGLKTLRDLGAFGRRSEKSTEPTKPDRDRLYDEFVERVMQVAEVGCVNDSAHPRLAEAALGQIRTEIVGRRGRWVVAHYLGKLAKWAALAIVLFALVLLGGTLLAVKVDGYALVCIGAMAGVWSSAASRRREVAFKELADYAERKYEPAIRVCFVAITSAAFALLLEAKILELKINNIDLGTFGQSARLALALGFVCGFGERLIPDRLTAALGGKSGD